MSLATLPPELYLAILSHVADSDLQLSTLNLSRAIPLAPVPLRPLFEHISVARQQQLPLLYMKLRYSPQRHESGRNYAIADESTWVKRFNVLIWEVDADILLNVLALLPALEHLSLRFGPIFTPEHLQGIFRQPLSSLKILNLRFRPYVKRVTYYQFLKGSYFDSIFDLISSWSSSSSLTRLSIIQDPLPRSSLGAYSTFAQPIVFFSLNPLIKLSLSPASQKITHLRLRVPSRQLAPYIASPPVDILRYPFPNATLLDMSTSSIHTFNELESLLNFAGGGQLQHLLLDGTDHTALNGITRDWEMLGRTCALAGVKHSRNVEKTLKSWRQVEATAGNDNQDHTDDILPGNAQDRRPRPGRRGMATATISLRDRPTVSTSSTLLPTPLPGSSHKATKIRICPSPPRLLSLCMSLPRPLQQHGLDDIRNLEIQARADFARGWSEGVGQLRSIWNRLQQSQSNGVKVVRFAVGGENGLSNDNRIRTGLIEVNGPHDDNWWAELGTIKPPVLCFSGPRGEDYVGNDWSGHPKGCGHQFSWDTWSDNL